MNSHAHHEPEVGVTRPFPPGIPSRALGCGFVLAVALVLASCMPTAESPPPAVTSGEWREFDGSWNAVGTRRTITLGAERKGSILDLGGTMLFTGQERPGVGFRAEVIALVDSDTGLVGRSVWTDEHGDQVFSELVGEGTAARNRVKGSIMGGTGRYGGVTGSYEFVWQSVMEAADGTIQGRTVDMKVRVWPGQRAAGASIQ